MENLLSLLANESVMALVLGLLGLGAAWLLRRGTVRKYKLERAVQCLEAGVRHTYEEFVRARKRAAEDGKLDDRERAEANRRALDAAREFARAEGVDLAKYYAVEYLPVLVDRIAQRGKNADAPGSAMAGLAGKIVAAALPMLLRKLEPATPAYASTAASAPTASTASADADSGYPDSPAATPATAAANGSATPATAASAVAALAASAAGLIPGSAGDDPLLGIFDAADRNSRDPFFGEASPGWPRGESPDSEMNPAGGPG